MKPMIKAAGITSLALVLWVGSGSAQRPDRNDESEGTITGGGTSALRDNDGGNDNTAYGLEALLRNTSGSGNSAFGSRALVLNTTGSGNTAAGRFALFRSTGSNNTAVGAQALRLHETGFDNTAIGTGALGRRTGGNNNIAIGSGAGEFLTGGANNIYIGKDVGVEGTESNTIRIGAFAVARTFIRGIVDAPVNGTPVFVGVTGQLGVQVSSGRYKRDIETMGSNSQGLLQLRPVTFSYSKDLAQKRQYGLIAEEVMEVYPELVTRGANGQVEGVQYHQLIPMLVNELQRQQRQQEELKKENAELAGRLERLGEAVTRAAARERP